MSPLKNSLKIDLYNDMYFDASLKIQSAAKDCFSCQMDKQILEPHVLPDHPLIKDICMGLKPDVGKTPPIKVVQQVYNGCSHADIIDL